MNKFRLFKRFTAFILILSMAVSIMPLNIIFANYQSHVRNVVVRTVTAPNNRNYDLVFKWDNPVAWSNKEDTETSPPDEGKQIHTPEGYKIMSQNATAGDSQFNLTEQLDGNADLNSANSSIMLNTGSIYAFQVLPYHQHHYLDSTIAGGNIITKDAPYDNSIPVETSLFMSDIEIQAKGAGSELTVTWDNPLYFGNNVFTGYKIYYERGGSNVTKFTNSREISIDDEKLIKETDKLRKGVQKLTYTIEDPKLVQGDVYAVKVEPLYNSTEIRDSSLSGLGYGQVSINDKKYNIGFTPMSVKEYRTDDASVSIPLEVYEDGKDYLKLHWWGISNTIGTIERIEIYSGTSEESLATAGDLIGELYTPQATFVNTWQITNKPEKKTYYQIRVYIKEKPTPLLSEITNYDPSSVNITPNKPAMFININNTGSTTALDVFWDVFLRYPYNEDEESYAKEEYNGQFIDTNVVYDLWISDSQENLEDGTLPKTLEEVPPSSLTQTTIEESKLPVYQTSITTYTTKDEDGNFIVKNLEHNKTYYIKLVARKLIEEGKNLSSEPVYGSKYIAIDGSISQPSMLSKPPLRIKKDSSGRDMITTDSITVEWNTKWSEVYNIDDDTWYTDAAVRDAQTIAFGDNILTSDKKVKFYDYTEPADIKSEFKKSGLNGDIAENLIIRSIDLEDKNLSYEMKVVPFNEINGEGGYKKYLEALLNGEGGDWTEITPTKNTSDYLETTVSNLEKNTAYVIIIRPYRILENGRKDAYPSFVIGTTLPDDIVVDITPTVPVLIETEHSDVSIGVKWKEPMEGMEYELVYSDKLLEDPASGGNMISSENIKENGTKKPENESSFIYYTINALFPETGYYIWVRSIANNSTGKVYSKWSNPIYVVTDTLGPPNPPDGLGKVAKDHLNTWNKANEKKYLPVDTNYIIVEWLKDYNDLMEANTEAGGGEGGTEVLSDPDIKETYIVKFNNLDVNQMYYFRAKTKLIVTRGSEGELQRKYSYTIQMSKTDDFIDYVEVVVPSNAGDSENESTIIKESDWCRTIVIVTGKDDTEYNGQNDDLTYPLPDDDFELLYDGETQTLTYRFRSDKEDDRGKDDNLVDQRFITKLFKNRVYKYTVDLTNYNGREIKNRVVEIPYTVMSAFNERQVEFELKADNATIVFPPDFLEVPEVEHLVGYGKGADVKISVENLPTDVPALTYNQKYVSNAQKISVNVITPERTVNIKNTPSNVKISLKLSTRQGLEDENVSSYYKDSSMDNWNRINSNYDYAQGTFTSLTKSLGTFTAIAISAPQPTKNDEISLSSIKGITTKMYIEDIQSFRPDSPVSSVQFNNIVAAVANNKLDASLNDALSEEDYKALGSKGILLNGAQITRELGINALVKLYEAKTGQRIKNYSSLNETPYSDIRDASPDFQQALLKAGDLGFFDNTTGARPKQTMSLGELFYIIDIIIQDSDM